MTVRRLALVGFALVSCVLAAHPEALSEPLPLCRPGTLAVAPAYAELGAPPEITQWRDVWIGPDNCFQQVDGPMELVVTLAARFRHSGGLEDLAARAGAISATRSIRYWSVTNDRWRPLISDAFAVSDAETRVPRFNFASDEVLSGESLQRPQPLWSERAKAREGPICRRVHKPDRYPRLSCEDIRGPGIGLDPCL